MQKRFTYSPNHPLYYNLYFKEVAHSRSQVLSVKRPQSHNYFHVTKIKKVKLWISNVFTAAACSCNVMEILKVVITFMIPISMIIDLSLHFCDETFLIVHINKTEQVSN